MTRYFLFILCIIYLDTSTAQFKVSSVFSSNMVIQRDQAVKVWGRGTPGREVSAEFSGETYSVIVKSDSTWEITLNPVPAGGPYIMNINGGKQVVFNNVMAGDVYLCSGQSNMNMPLAGWGRINNYLEEIAVADYPEIRLLTIPFTMAHEPLDDVNNNGWKICSPETISDFSAVAYFFAREIQKNIDVPIGLVHSSKGGSPIEAWMSKSALNNYPEFHDEIRLVENSSSKADEEIYEKYKNDLTSWLDQLNNNEYGSMENSDMVIENSISVDLPTVWEKHGFENYNGLMWFVKSIQLEKSWFKNVIELQLGTTDDYDAVFVNGHMIGENRTKTAPSIYTISDELLFEGENLIAVRVLDVSGRGGFFGKASDIYLKNSKNYIINIAKNWELIPGIELDDITPGLPERPFLYKRPTVLFNGMINPVKDLKYKAVLWYQGESNSSRASQYRTLFPDMINHWRTELDNDELPFYFVQLTSYYLTYNQRMNNGWCELREAQAEALDLPNTGMAVTIDIGAEFDVHPKNKQEVGRRLALIALENLYDLEIACRGPQIKDYKIENGKVFISFDYVYNGLMTNDGMAPREFVIAGPDSVFYPAQAEILGDKIIVRSDRVDKPVAVGYAWDSYPDCNLFNSEGLPAAPFRTDDWNFNAAK